MNAEDISVDLVLNEISRVSQSKKNLRVDNSLNIHASCVRMPTGSGYNRFDKFLLKKKSIIKIKNKDNLCALRCMIVGKAYADKKKNASLTKIYKSLINSHSKKQDKEVLKLVRALNLIDEPCGLEEIVKIEKYFKNYQVYIIDRNSNYEFIYKGPEQQMKIFMLKNNNHFDLITSLPSFFETRNFCLKCLKGYENFEYHKCNNVCKSCRSRYCVNRGEELYRCSNCSHKCSSELCLALHQEKICKNLSECKHCNKYVSSNHLCNGRWCCNCKCAVPWEHKCFVLTENERFAKKSGKNDYKGFIFYDYESMVDADQHIPNLVCAQKICKNCLDKWQYIENSNCASGCGVHVFYTNDSFCQWILLQDDFICIAHNMRAYDGIFIMNYLTKNPLPNDMYVN